MANRIFRGPRADSDKRTVNLPVAGAYLPGVLVTRSATALTVAGATDDEKELLVLSNRDFDGQDVATAYTSGDTGIAYTVEPGDEFQVRMAGATYTYNQNLSVAASGYLAAAATGDVVVARFTGTAGAVTAGALADVTWANSFVMA